MKTTAKSYKFGEVNYMQTVDLTLEKFIEGDKFLSIKKAYMDCRVALIGAKPLTRLLKNTKNMPKEHKVIKEIIKGQSNYFLGVRIIKVKRFNKVVFFDTENPLTFVEIK